MKKIVLASIAFIASHQVFSQYEISSFTSTGRGGATSFVTDYQACGINPANLGWHSEFDKKKVTFGFTEFTFSLHSGALTKDELRSEIKNSIQGRTASNWTYQQKKDAAQSFANSGLGLNMDLGSFGFSFATEKFGGIAFRINDNMSFYSKLGDKASELLFLGRRASIFDSLIYVNPSTFDTTVIANNPNLADSISQHVISGFASQVPQYIGQIMNGSELRASWTREYNLSYGRKIFGKDDVIEVFAGIGLKYIQGFAMIDVRSENNKLEAFSAITPFFNIDYGSAASINPSTIGQGGSKMPKPVGNGYGADFGVDVLIKNKLKIALAATNIGSMTWSGNVYSMKDTLVFNTESAGLNNFNFAEGIKDLGGGDGLFKWDGLTERKTALPTTIRFGSSFLIKEIAQIGFDIILPAVQSPAQFDRAIIGLGGDIKPIPWLRISAGFLTGGNYDFSIPLGLTIVSPKGTWEGGVASRDVVTFFTQNGPTLSFSTGFLRFRI